MNPDKKKKRMQALFMVAAVLIFWNVMQIMNNSSMTRIACVGDSITFGTGVEDREENCYPVQLQKLLGTKKYRVGNFGVDGATLQKKGDKPYWEEERYEQSLSYKADIVVLMLGTNDTKDVNWKDGDSFVKDCKEMIKAYQETSEKPEVILMTPPAVHPFAGEGETKSLMQADVAAEEAGLLESVGREEKLTVINLYEKTKDHPEWFNRDGVHPNKEGAKVMAEVVEETIEKKLDKNGK